jgi:hypothetical protein
LAIAISTLFFHFAISGVAISGMVYVPMPAYICTQMNPILKFQNPRLVVAYLIIDELLVTIALLQHREELNNIGILNGTVSASSS